MKGLKRMAGVKKDCFAYNEKLVNRSCTALRELYCAKEECKFYKTKEQYQKEIGSEKR